MFVAQKVAQNFLVPAAGSSVKYQFLHEEFTKIKVDII